MKRHLAGNILSVRAERPLGELTERTTDPFKESRSSSTSMREPALIGGGAHERVLAWENSGRSRGVPLF